MKGLFFDDYQRLMSNSHQLLDHIFKTKIMAMKYCKEFLAVKPNKFGRSGTHLFKKAAGIGTENMIRNSSGKNFEVPQLDNLLNY